MTAPPPPPTDPTPDDGEIDDPTASSPPSDPQPEPASVPAAVPEPASVLDPQPDPTPQPPHAAAPEPAPAPAPAPETDPQPALTPQPAPEPTAPVPAEAVTAAEAILGQQPGTTAAAEQPFAPPPEPTWPVEQPPQPAVPAAQVTPEPTILSAQPPPEPTILTAQPPPAESPAEPAAAAPASGQSVASLNVDRATALTEEFLDRGAPWSQNTSWRIVLGEGIVAAIVGLIVLLQPLGVSTTLQIVGFALLLGALLTAFQIWRGRIEPGREVLASFRAGSGVTVGLVVIVATFFTAVTETVTASLAVVVGVGFIVFGLAGIAASYVGRRELEPLPMAILVANAALVVAGIVLMLSGAAGSSTVGSVFNLLGVAFIVAGLGLCGYGYMLRQQEEQGFRR